jgi:hypothetical protein
VEKYLSSKSSPDPKFSVVEEKKEEDMKDGKKK